MKFLLISREDNHGGDWYVVVEDPSQIPRISGTMAGTSTASRFSDTMDTNDTSVLY